jgi:serine/threonine-protein kinase RsbW
LTVRSELLLDSRVEEVARARDWLSQQAAAGGFSDSEVRKLGLVLSEACVNVIEHAYGGEAGNPIELLLSIDNEALRLTIRDFGARFAVEDYEPPDLSEPHEGGYGVFIMHSLMDEVKYDTAGQQGTVLTLVKRRHQPPRARKG